MQPIRTYQIPSRKGRKIERCDYDSMGAFRRDLQEAKVASRYSGASQSSWWGGDSFSQLMERTIHGDERHIHQAQAYLDQIQDELEIPKPQWSPSPFGAFPSVPAFLSGEIDCMRHLISDPDASAPVRVFFDPTSSAVIDAKDLQKRGSAALALTMALAQIRPVELWTFSDLDAHGDGMSLISVKIQTAPLMLSEACFALCNPGYARGLTYGLAEVRMGFQGMWGFGEYCSDAVEREALLREALGAAPLDVVIPGISYQDELVKDPVGFIKRELARHQRQLEQA